VVSQAYKTALHMALKNRDKKVNPLLNQHEQHLKTIWQAGVCLFEGAMICLATFFVPNLRVPVIQGCN
jgi:hypothetical protein